MPLREFACRDCNARFEDIVSGEETSECPRCGSRRLNRLLSTFAVAGGQGPSREPSGEPGACGSCGDPRGPGACRLDD